MIHKIPMTYPSDFLHKSSLGIALVGVVILTPFSINNFFQHRYVLGAGSLAIVIILAVNAWFISRDRYYPSITLLGLIPTIIFFLVLALVRQGNIGAFWCYPAIISFYFMLPERKAWIVNVIFLGVIFPVAWQVLNYPLALRFGATLLAVSIFSAIFIRVITEQQKKLQSLAVTDPLTGLFNRSLLRSTLEHAIEQHNRKGESMTILAMDLDRFKSINDTKGHDAGDMVLRGVGEFLGKRFRRIDKVFRTGGEEFLALLHGTDLDNGNNIAEELRIRIETQSFAPAQQITVSIGVAVYQPGEDWKEWMKRADQNLYRAKIEGRNRVVA